MEDAAQFDRGRIAGGVVSAVAIKGWCPGALRPMRSGDGLLVRIRPYGGRLDARQAMRIAELAHRYGNGLIDLTSRANFQIRGVSDDGHLPLVQELSRLNLIDDDPESEARRNSLVTPFWRMDDETSALAAELEQALIASSLDLPGKFGFAVDCVEERALADASADIRIERDENGELIVRADGAERGRVVTRAVAIEAALALSAWFVKTGGARAGRGRMAAHLAAGAQLPTELCGDARPAHAMPMPTPGFYPQGVLVGVAFGQLTYTALAALAGSAGGVRLTPWRMILAEGAHELPRCDGLVTRAADPLLRVVACSGAPACREAHADTRALAAALAPRLPADARLHVSGCAKGCAQAGAASITLVATRDGFDVIRNGTTRDMPALRGLSGAAIVANPNVLMEGP
ncbi:precorrin-3B synthase [Mesorhizobium sp.]|uniref:precorrin-3B synthase n=1 Tax=Mesorhizobium sp. TaxID=1871066 RepID=UPI0025EDCBF1|nr:precorrin-3B synthase [Mesorhizobium sp.]